jgi:hypothetical protein
MKLNSVIIVWAFTAVFIVAAGCTSFGGNGGPSATSYNTPAATVTSVSPTSQSSGSQTIPQSLTEAQKTQAASIVKADATMKGVLNKPGYSIVGVEAGTDAGALAAIVTIQGGDVQRADGSMWTQDQYTVTVNLDHGKVADIIHIEPKQLPTLKPS